MGMHCTFVFLYTTGTRIRMIGANYVYFIRMRTCVPEAGSTGSREPVVGKSEIFEPLVYIFHQINKTKPRRNKK